MYHTQGKHAAVTRQVDVTCITPCLTTSVKQKATVLLLTISPEG